MINVSVDSTSGVLLATAGKYCEENVNVTIANATNVIPENIKKGVQILDVIGTLETGGAGGVESGEFTPVNNTMEFSIATSLSVVHGVVILKKNGDCPNEHITMICGTTENAFFNEPKGNFYGCCIRSNWGNISYAGATSCPISVENGVITFESSSNFTYNCKFSQGATYKYFIF